MPQQARHYQLMPCHNKQEITSWCDATIS